MQVCFVHLRVGGLSAVGVLPVCMRWVCTFGCVCLRFADCTSLAWWPLSVICDFLYVSG